MIIADLACKRGFMDLVIKPCNRLEVNMSMARKRKKKPQPENYKLVCISMYNEDIARLKEQVDSLKSRGCRKASRSELIRFALRHVDVEAYKKWKESY